MTRRGLTPLLLLLLVGCSSYREVPRSELRAPGTFENVRVATVDGFEYRFDRVAVAGDTLVGYYSVAEERANERQEIWYEDVLRSHHLPLDRVAAVDLIRKDPVKTALYGASLAAAGYLLGSLVEEERGDPSRGGGGGKPPIHP
jgi:hypothetical protein